MNAITETDHKITRAIPGYTAGAGKCFQCGEIVAWCHSRVHRDEQGQQIGIMSTFYCDSHKPELKA